MKLVLIELLLRLACFFAEAEVAPLPKKLNINYNTTTMEVS